MFDGPGNVQALADSVEMTSDYELFYRLCSEPIHGSNLLRGGIGFSPDGKHVGIAEIRYFDSMEAVLFLSTEIAIAAYRGADEYLGLDMTKDIDAWYIGAIRGPAQSAAKKINW